MDICVIAFYFKNFFSHPFVNTLLGIMVGYSLSIARDSRKSKNLKKIIFSEISSMKKTYSDSLKDLIDQYKNRKRLNYTSPKNYDAEYLKSLIHEYALYGHYLPLEFRYAITEIKRLCEIIKFFDDRRDELINNQKYNSIIIPKSETGSMIVHCTLLIYGLDKLEKHKFKIEFNEKENWTFIAKNVAENLKAPLDDELINKLRRENTVEAE